MSWIQRLPIGTVSSAVTTQVKWQRVAGGDNEMRVAWCGTGDSIDVTTTNGTVCQPQWIEPALDRYAYQVCDEGWTVGTGVVRYSCTWIWEGDDQCLSVADPRKRLAELLHSRSAPAVLRRRRHLPPADDEREMRARDTLRRVIGEERWRRFVRDGYITVHSKKDGRTYQIFPGSQMTRVYARGELVERLCCYLRGNFPPTDHLISRFLLVLNDPAAFRKMSIVHHPFHTPLHTLPTAAEPLDLPAEFRRLKAAGGAVA